MTKLKTNHFYLSPTLHKQFSDTCKTLGLSKSAIVNMLVKEWLVDSKVYEEARIEIIKTKSLGKYAQKRSI